MEDRNALVLRAPAKINLSLKVTGRRDDGYHLLDTLMHKLELSDELSIALCDQGVHLACTDSTLPVDERNLVHRAATLFLHATRTRRCGKRAGVRFELHKNIPVGAGLGGGSSDAAAALKGLNLLHGQPCDAAELAELGVQLGADVPFFLTDFLAARATGIGEILQAVEPLRDLFVVLVNPGFSVSTRWVYQNFALTPHGNTGNLNSSESNFFEGSIGTTETGMPYCASVNDLETVTAVRYPVIGQIKDDLLAAGARLALMSGSGPTVFGLFLDRDQAEACLGLCRQRYAFSVLTVPA
ncbi:MAG: 4-(cytidine 5'-diphospho)-2-C-methyl-D-erythritol kinase [Desulfobulbus sp.]